MLAERDGIFYIVHQDEWVECIPQPIKNNKGEYPEHVKTEQEKFIEMRSQLSQQSIPPQSTIGKDEKL